MRIGYLGVAFVAATFLGLALTFAGSTFYGFYERAPRLWGLTPLEDQNLGGVLMTGEQALVFLAAIVTLLLRLLDEEEERERLRPAPALRAAVLGANDGLCSNLSLVMGVAGTHWRMTSAATPSSSPAWRAFSRAPARHGHGRMGPVRPSPDSAAVAQATGAPTKALSSTGSAPGTIACVSRACSSVVRTMSFARAKLSSCVGTGPTRLPERVAGCVPPHRAVRLERVERRHAEELEVVERLEVGAVDHRRALRLEADRDARAGEPRAVVRDERDVGDAADADEARRAPALADALADRVEHVAVVEVGDRAADRLGERRTDCDDDLRRVVAGLARVPVGHDRLRTGDVAEERRAGATTCGSDCRSSQRSPSRR